MQYLVKECNCDPREVKDNNGCTALHYASWSGHLDIVKYLIEKENCDVEIKDDNGHTALHRASLFGHLDVVKYLVEECHAKVTAEIIEDIKSDRIKNKKIETYLRSKHDGENQ